MRCYLEVKGTKKDVLGGIGGVGEKERVIPRDKEEGLKGRCRERRKEGGRNMREVSERN